jgi:Arc/MetJ family transcription regulator
MSREAIDIDDELLAEAARALGTATATETVDAALREALEWRRPPVAPPEPELPRGCSGR